MTKPTKPGLYLYRKPTGRLSIAHVTRSGDKLYAILLRHKGWRKPNVYSVGAMGGEWIARLVKQPVKKR